MEHLIELTDAELELASGGSNGFEDLFEDIFDLIEDFLDLFRRRD